MKTTIDRVGRIRRVALALWRRLNPSSAADDGPRSFEEAQPPGLTPAPVFSAGEWIDVERLKCHLAIVGASRTGKSLLLLLYLRSVISQITPGSDRRLVIFDHNQMLHPALFDNVQVPVHFFLPNHRLTSRWDLAGGDLTSPAAVTQLCEALVPEVRGCDPGFPALDRLNMLLFTQLFSQLLDQSDSATSRTHVVLDELPLAAGDRRPLPGLKDICERGASRGVVLAVTFRSYADMKALYQHDADAILGMLQNKIFLRAPDVPTAKYASEAFRKWHEWIDVSGEYHALDAVPYEKFLELPPASPKDGITGYCLSPRARRSPEVFHLPGHWIAANLPKGR
jgi:type IV secretory system conjugative DNA transfer VirD4/TraG family protein